MISQSKRRHVLDRCDIVDRGAGPVTALAHGAGGGVLENFAPLIEAAPHRRFVGPYYPGAGRTPSAPEPLSADALADTVVAAALEAGAERFPIVGLSLGAAVAVTAAVRHPEHVAALVLTGGFARADAQTTAFTRVWRRLADHGDHDALAELLLHAVGSPQTLASLSPEQHTAAVRRIRRDHPVGGAAHAELVGRVDVRPLLASVEVPTLVVTGGQDRVVLPATTRRLASGIGGAESIEYPSAGHIFTDAEARRWSADVTAFLDGVPL